MADRARDAGLRRVPRLATQLSGILTVRGPFPVTVLDLSLRGCLARCPVRLDRGLIADIEMTIEGVTFAAKVRVADSSRDGESSADVAALYLTGLEFMALTPQGELLLRRFLDQERRRQQSGV